MSVRVLVILLTRLMPMQEEVCYHHRQPFLTAAKKYLTRIVCVGKRLLAIPRGDRSSTAICDAKPGFMLRDAAKIGSSQAYARCVRAILARW